MKYILTLLCFLILGCAHQPIQSNYLLEGSSNYFGTSKVHRYRLKNGLKVLILEDHSAPTVAYHTWFKVGSSDETMGKTGLAHLFEHMMFRETVNYKEGEFDRILEEAGAEGENAFTSQDYTGYVQSMPIASLELLMKLEAERMVNLVINENSLAKELEVVKNERRFRNDNSPDGQIIEKMYHLAYTKQSYHWPVIGYEKDLNTMTKNDCLAFYKRFYAPNNATVVIVGDVNPDRTMKLINQYYGALKPATIDRPRQIKEPTQTAERSETLPIKSGVEKLLLAFHSVDINNPDFAILEVFKQIIAGGKSSRLYKKLVDSGIASAVEAENGDSAYPGLFFIFVNLQKGKNAHQAMNVIEHEIKEISKGHFTEQEMQTAVSMHRLSVFDSLASESHRAHFLGFYETVANRFERGTEIINSLKSVNKVQIASVAKQYFKKENRTTIIGKPSK